jgi:hypothetical protein
MSFSDALNVISLVLGTSAIVIAIVIYRRQTHQSNAQGKILERQTHQSNEQREIIDKINELTDHQSQRATALANLELREKFGTISSRAERLEEVRRKTSADLQLTEHLTPRKKEQILEWRAQLMYLLYDCLAVDEAYGYAAATTQGEFKELMFGYNDVWKELPMIHGERAELCAAGADSIFKFFAKRLRVYRDNCVTDADSRELSSQLADSGA